MRYSLIFLLMLLTFAACDDFFIADKKILDAGHAPLLPPGTWGTVAGIGAGGGAPQNPRIAIDHFGNAVAVWEQTDGLTVNIYANHYLQNAQALQQQGWQVPMRINDVSSGTCSSPEVACDYVGNAIIIWLSTVTTPTTTNTVFAKKYYANQIWTNALSWGEQLTIAGPLPTIDDPRIAMNRTGSALVLYTDMSDGNRNLLATRYSHRIGWIAGGWGPALTLDTNWTPVNNHQIAMNSSGNALVVWQQSDGARDQILARAYTDSDLWAMTNWGTPSTIDIGSGNGSVPQVAIDDAGNAMAVWQAYTVSNYDIHANYYKAGTGWETARAIEDLSGSASSPQVALDARGNAMVVWAHSENLRNRLYANRYTAGKSWITAWNASPVLIEQEPIGNAANPRVAFDAAGYAYALWEQNDGSSTHIFWNRYSPVYDLLAAWGTAGVAEADTMNAGHNPRFVIPATGTIIAVWEQMFNTAQNIVVNIYK